MVKNWRLNHYNIQNYSLTLRQHYGNDVSADIFHFDNKNEFYGENKDRKRLVRIVISAFFVPQNLVFGYHKA